MKLNSTPLFHLIKFIIFVCKNINFIQKNWIILSEKIMSGRIRKTVTRTLKYFTNPLIQGKYQVIPPPPIPNHITPAPYINNPNPQYGQY